MIQEHDEPILEHLKDVSVKFSTEPMVMSALSSYWLATVCTSQTGIYSFQGFTLEFHFAENEYFADSVLSKWYEMRSEPDESDPFSFQGPEIVACTG